MLTLMIEKLVDRKKRMADAMKGEQHSDEIPAVLPDFGDKVKVVRRVD
jgi:hypothetical protein